MSNITRKYRAKPLIIEAAQFNGFYATPYPYGVMMEDNSNNPERGKRYQFYVVSHGQRINIEINDWVITEPDGSGYYPCKPDIFKAKYELIKDEIT